MRQVSQEFRNAVQQNTNVSVKATLVLSDGTSLDIVNSDFVIGTVSFDEATSSTGSFDIGSAIVGQFKATIANYDGKFSKYDFSDSTITPSVGTTVNGSMEWLQVGVYDIDRPTSTGRSIKIQAYDKLNSMKVALNTVSISYPTTLGDIALKLCDACGVTLESSAFPNNDYQIESAPKLVDSDTCLSGLAWVAQIACCYVKCNNRGHITLGWYDPADFKDSANINGGSFDTTTKPYSDGDAADGGTFDDYSEGYKADAGEFSNRRFWVLARNQQSTVSTDDVTITGVSVTAQDAQSDGYSSENKGETALSGKKGYVLSITGNKFVSFGTAQKVANLIAPNVVGLKFRPFSASTLGNPVMDCGDAVYITDYNSNAYKSYITQLTYTVGSYESVACNAETPTHNAAINASASTKALQESKALVANERSAREAALKRLSQQVSEKAGLYQTTETLSDGSKIFYLHDAETIGRSKTVWKMTAQAIAVSVDGGKSYTSGLSADGNAILNRVYAIGLNADYLNVGRISGPPNFTVTSTHSVYQSKTSPMTIAETSDLTNVSFNADTELVYPTGRYVSLWENFSERITYPGAIVATLLITATGVGPFPDFRYLVKKYDGTTEWRTYSSSDGNSTSGQMYSIPYTVELGDDVEYVLNCGFDFKVDSPAYTLTYISFAVGTGEDKQSYWDLETGQFVTNGMQATDITASGSITATSGMIGSFNLVDGALTGKYVKLADKNHSSITFYTIENSEQKTLGHIGNDHYTQDKSVNGLVVDIDPDASFFSIGAKSSSSDTSWNMKFAYCKNAFSTFKSDTLNAGAPLDMQGYAITNIGNGQSVSLRLSVLNDVSFNNGGIQVGNYSNNCNLRFTCGLLTGWSWTNGEWEKL